MNWYDDLDAFSAQFRGAFADIRGARILAYATVGACILFLLAGAFSEITRPRIYVVREGDTTKADDER